MGNMQSGMFRRIAAGEDGSRLTRDLVTRRHFLHTSALGVAAAAAYALGLPVPVLGAAQRTLQFHQMVKDSKNPTNLEKEHLINIRLPLIAEDGSNVPIVVSMDHHPMQPDHYIKSIQILNFNDPVVNKGVFRFSPAIGQPYISTQIRMDGGDVEVFVVAECSKHGKWVASRKLKVSLGGC